MKATHTVGPRIRLYRERQGLTLDELARRANISKGYLSQLERNLRSRPSADVLQGIARALGISLTDLLDSVQSSRNTKNAAGGNVPADMKDDDFSEIIRRLPKWLVNDVEERRRKGLPVYLELLRFIASREASGDHVTPQQYARVLGGAAARGLGPKEDLNLLEWADFFALVNEIHP